MVEVGKRYLHFKGRVVIVDLIAKDSETLEDMVVYHHENEDTHWVRPVKMFTSKVDRKKYPNVLQEERFKLID